VFALPIRPSFNLKSRPSCAALRQYQKHARSLQTPTNTLNHIHRAESSSLITTIEQPPSLESPTPKSTHLLSPAGRKKHSTPSFIVKIHPFQIYSYSQTIHLLSCFIANT